MLHAFNLFNLKVHIYYIKKKYNYIPNTFITIINKPMNTKSTYKEKMVTKAHRKKL